MSVFTFTIIRGADHRALQKSRVGPRDKLNYVEFVVETVEKFAPQSRTLTNVYDVRIERMIAQEDILRMSGIVFTASGERPCKLDYDPERGTGQLIIYD